MNLITAEHLTHSYTERKLFDDASFSLNEQEKVGIIGINGTGKSTLLKILAGREEPDEGIVIMGRNLRISYLPQNPVFPESFDVLTAALPLADDISGSPMDYEADAKSMLTKLGITQLNQNITELSGGQRKRIALVRTLLTPSDILILDEPTAGLDPRGRDRILDQLKTYHRSHGGTIILVSHSMEDVAKYVDRIIVMNQGSVMFDDIPKSVFAHYKELEAVGLAAPQVTYLMHELAAAGIPVSMDATTVAEAKEEILAKLGR